MWWCWMWCWWFDCLKFECVDGTLFMIDFDASIGRTVVRAAIYVDIGVQAFPHGGIED